MIMNPAIIALLAASFFISVFALYASYTGYQILSGWDPKSGSEFQLNLERRTYLVSTIMRYMMVFELLSLVLFVATADRMHPLFIGAMCAAGSLNVNDYGYVTLLVKLITFVLCGVWLILNAVDMGVSDTPLIRTKYMYLIFLTALIVLGAFLQAKYFTGLEADVITSCCGILFSEESQSVAGQISALSPRGMKILFTMTLLLYFRTGFHFAITGKAAKLFSFLALAVLVVSLAAVISFISVYHYRLPTHHCPFCLLQKDYYYIGYPLYGFLFLGGITGIAVGLLEKLKGPQSLKERIPRYQKRLTWISLAAYAAFGAVAVYPMLFSDFIPG